MRNIIVFGLFIIFAYGCYGIKDEIELKLEIAYQSYPRLVLAGGQSYYPDTEETREEVFRQNSNTFDDVVEFFKENVYKAIPYIKEIYLRNDNELDRMAIVDIFALLDFEGKRELMEFFRKNGGEDIERHFEISIRGDKLVEYPPNYRR